jgi:hypothetical protein
MRSWLVLVALAAGCWSARSPEETAPPPSLAAVERPPERWPATGRANGRPRGEDRCTRALGHVFELARRDASSSRFTPAMLDDVQSAAVESCHETQWADDLLDCYDAATSTSGTIECFRSMTDEQREDFQQRIVDVQARHANIPPPARPTP